MKTPSNNQLVIARIHKDKNKPFYEKDERSFDDWDELVYFDVQNKKWISFDDSETFLSNEEVVNWAYIDINIDVNVDFENLTHQEPLLLGSQLVKVVRKNESSINGVDTWLEIVNTSMYLSDGWKRKGLNKDFNEDEKVAFSCLSYDCF
jgi:hypothetical protein